MVALKNHVISNLQLNNSWSSLISMSNLKNLYFRGYIHFVSLSFVIWLSRCHFCTLQLVFTSIGGSSTKSHRPQAEKEGGWVMAIFEKKSIYLKNSTGIFCEF